MAVFGFNANEARFLLTLPACSGQVQVLRFSAQDALNTPWEIAVTLVSESEDLDPASIVGTPVSLKLTESQGDSYYHGKVWQFRRQAQGKRLTQYQLVMRPSLAWLELGNTHRIFQEKSVPDIIKQILQEQNISSDQTSWSLTRTYLPRTYCVQYNEGNLQFITRLLAEEGIHFHYKHTAELSQLVFADQTAGWSSGLPATQYKPGRGQVNEDETIQSFQVTHQVATSAASRRYFNYQQPTRFTEAQKTQSNATAQASHLSHYDYRGNTLNSTQAENTAKQHLDALQRDTVTACGQGSLSAVRSGYLFSLTGHGCETFNRQWLLTRVSLVGEQPQVLEEFSNGQSSLHSEFQAIPSDTVWVPELLPAKPLLQGIQTATVTGPSGEEIYTDSLGRIKVQFHWDRDGKEDEKTSCWLRVMHDWAGNGYGVVRLPRIGQEVQISFEEGDPDKPLVTGSLHNAEQMPPWEQPTHKTRSGILTRSTPDGTGTNELLFEDLKGQEELRWQAEKDWDAKILNDSHTRIDGTHERTVAGNDYRKIEGELSQAFEANQMRYIKQDQHSTHTGTVEHYIEQNTLTQANQQIHWSSKNKAIYHAGTELTIAAGGSFIKLDPSGVTISGPAITVNQGGSAISGTAEAAQPPVVPSPAQDAAVGLVPVARQAENSDDSKELIAKQFIYSE
jgi:type VI secretion system secreted protein VgrG